MPLTTGDPLYSIVTPRETVWVVPFVTQIGAKPAVDEPQVTLLDYLYTWLKWRRLIVYTVGITCLIAAGVSLILPKWYRATTTILPPKPEAGMGIAASFGSLPLGVDLFGTGRTVELNTYVAIIRSRRVLERVARTFQLQKVYKTQMMDDTIRALDKNVEIDITKEQTLTLSVLDRDPVRVAEITNFFIDELDRINKTLSTEQARNNRLFIERRLAQNRRDIQRAEEALKAYQEQHQTFGLSEESQSAILAGAELEARVMALEVQRDVFKRMLGTSHPFLTQMSTEIEASKQRLSDLPEVGLGLARLTRDVEIQSRLLKYLIPQYEQAQIQEARDTPTVQILDRAVPPQRKHSPKRLFIVLGAGVASLFFSLFLTLNLESVRQAREQGSPRAHRIDRIIGELRAILPSRRE